MRSVSVEDVRHGDGRGFRRGLRVLSEVALQLHAGIDQGAGLRLRSRGREVDGAAALLVASLFAVAALVLVGEGFGGETRAA